MWSPSKLKSFLWKANWEPSADIFSTIGFMPISLYQTMRNGRGSGKLEFKMNKIYSCFKEHTFNGKTENGYKFFLLGNLGMFCSSCCLRFGRININLAPDQLVRTLSWYTNAAVTSLVRTHRDNQWNNKNQSLSHSLSPRPILSLC